MLLDFFVSDIYVKKVCHIYQNMHTTVFWQILTFICLATLANVVYFENSLLCWAAY